MTGDAGVRGVVTIREAEPDDLAAVNEIYNEAILKTTGTFDTQPLTLDQQRAWLARHGARHPVLVVVLDEAIIGWASLSAWSERQAYARTAEVSLYVKEESQGRGIGRRLMEDIIREGERAGLHTVIARIAEGNEASVHLHESVGFRHIGIMKEVGWKFGKLLDVYLMQKVYE